MPDPRLRWGIAGFGWVARDFMWPAIRTAGHTLVAACDPDPKARDAALADGASAYATLAELAADDRVEAVYVATPNHLHRGAVESLARAGKAILCEKPMAATLADAEGIVDACQAAGVFYGTAFDQRHHPAHVALRDALRAGLVGTVTAVRIVYACWLGPEWGEGGGRDNWRVSAAKAGGGALMDLAPHGLDLVDFLLGEPIVDVAALTQRRVQPYEVDDGAVLVGRTRSGVLASLHVGYNYPETLPRRRLEVIGTRGQIVAGNTMGQDAGGTLVFAEAATGTSRPLDVADADVSPFLAQVRAFARAFHARDGDTFSAERDLGTMRLLDRAYRSAAGNGGPS